MSKKVNVIGANGVTVEGILIGNTVTIEKGIKDPNDMDAGRKFYSQLEQFLSVGETLRSVKPRNFTDINYGTVRNILTRVRAVADRREINVTSASIIRSAAKYGALRVMSALV